MDLLIDLQARQNGSGERGIGRYAMAMAKAMIRQGGHRITVVLSAAFPERIMPIRRELEGLLPQERIVIFSPPSQTSSADPANAWRCRAAEMLRAKFFEDLAPDAVFNPSLMEGWWDRAISSIEPGPYVNAVAVHDFIPLDYPTRYLTAPTERETYLRKIQGLRGADVLLAISDFVRKETVHHLGVSASKVFLAPNGVDERFRVADQGAPVLSLDRLGISRPFILNTSPLEYRKNIEGLVAGFASLPRELRTKHQLVILGKMDAHARRYIADLAAKEGLTPDTVVLPGFVTDDEMISLYGMCELFVFPSLSEGFGLPVLEAMACGAPALGSNATSIPEVIGRQDMLFDPTDATSIADAMARVLGDDDLRSDIRSYGLTRAKVFTWEKSAQSALIAIEDAVKRRRKAAPTPVAAPKPVQPTLALVTSSLAPQGRLAGHVATLVAELEGPYRVTLVAEQDPDNEFAQAVVERRGFDWFWKNATKFDRILYVLDEQAPQLFVDLLTAIPGAVFLHDPLAVGASRRPANQMPDIVQLAVLQKQGYRAFLDDETAHDPKEASRAVGAMLERGSLGLLTDASAVGANVMPITPIRLSNSAANDLRENLGIAAEARLVVALASNEAAKDDLIRAFRSINAQTGATAHLIVHLLDGVGQAASRTQVTELFGGVHLVEDTAPTYRGLLSAADAVLLPAKSDQLLIKLIRLDMTLSTAAVIDYSNDIRGACENAVAAVRQPSLVKGDEASSGAATLAAAVIIKALETFYLDPRPHPGRELAERLSFNVRGVQADAGDLAEVAISYDRGSAAVRPPAIYLDLSAFAGPHRRGRLDARRRGILRELLKAGGPNLRGVYSAEDGFFAAGHYLGRFVGLQGLHDGDEEAINFRAGDRIIGIESLNGFGPESLQALEAAEAFGAGLFYATLGDLPLRRPELIGDAVSLVLQVAAAPELSVDRRLLMQSPGQHRLGHAAKRDIDRLLGHDLHIDLIAIDTPDRSEPDPTAGLGEFELWRADPVIVAACAAFEAHAAEPLLGETDSLRRPGELDYTITGHIRGAYSLALINRALSRVFEAAYQGKVRIRAVETQPIDDTDGVPSSEKQQIGELMARPAASKGREVVISQHYPLLPPTGDPLLALSLFAWEETHVPPSTVASLGAYFDGVIAPSRFVEKALIDSGLRIPVSAIGQPADIAPYRAQGRKRQARARVTTFLHVSSCFPRKGADVLLTAWAKVFTSSDKVRLVIKTFPNPHNDIEEQVVALRKAYPKLAAIEVINRDIDLDGLLSLYDQADVMVLPTRGEGYNLPALEAMAAGLPLIVTDYGGHSDFCGPDEARLIRSTFALSGSHVRDGVSQWVEPDAADLADALSEFINPKFAEVIEQRRRRALDAADVASDDGAWLKRHEGLVADLLGAPAAAEPRIAWVSTWGVQCGLAQYSRYLLDHFPARTREKMVILCDDRTPPSFESDLAFEACWRFGPRENAARLAAAIDKAGCDVVVLQHQEGLVSWKDLAALCSDSRLIGRTIVIVLHNPRNLLRLTDVELYGIVSALAHVDRLLVHGVIDVNLLKSLGLTSNVSLLPHGAMAPQRTAWPRDFSVAAKPLIGCHGFFFRHKGIDKLIRAAALLRKEWPGLKLRLVNARFPDGTSDPLIAECKELAKHLGMADAIEWYSDFLPIDQINNLLSECDLLVLPYDESDDSASGAVRLALSSMTPLVATRVKIFSEIGDAAAWAQSNDPEELQRTIAPLLRSSAKRRELQEAMNAWLKGHDWGRIANTLDGMIHNLAQRRLLGWD